MKFSAIYQPANLFSLKESNSTNSGAKSLLIPSPYSIKMAVFNQAITIDGRAVFEEENCKEFSFIRDVHISYHVVGSFCVNNCFVTIQSLREGSYRGKPSFREYIYLTDNLEIIFDVKDKQAKGFLQKYLYRINYFGKRGCFFQFIGYRDNPNQPNVMEFDISNFNPGILQEFDDISSKAEFKHVDNFDSSNAKREKKIFIIPVLKVSSSKSYTHYQCC
ncbi:MAG: hypothetical protein EOM59_11880 [Clostridia bacterium]|nr:hypothetical protein [Clostridia bacterium]